MDPQAGGTSGARAPSLCDEVNAWLRDNWDPDLTVEQWWRIVAAAGWTAPQFPVEYGGKGLPLSAVRTVHSAFAKFGALRPAGGLGLLMAAPTIYTCGTPEQIEQHLWRILEGSVGWCQLFSEPGAGSDLAGLTTRAERDGDRWIINGQKVWTSKAQEADYGMLLARTDFSLPKHKGISWLILDLNQPGVTIRPLREMTGESVFNEVFLDDAVCHLSDLVGGEGNGWAVANTTLSFERAGIGAGGGHTGFPPSGPKGGMLGMRAGDAAKISPPSGLVIGLKDVLPLARATGRTKDPLIRQRLALLRSYEAAGEWNAQRARAESARGGGAAPAIIGKLMHARVTKLAAELGVDIAGAGGMLAAPDGAEAGRFSSAYVFSPASSIYGGTDEIHRNIAGEKVLGLPRDEQPDRDQPFGEVLRKHPRG
jgi:alkylation response protein AidB-like acyl-CoA dehydrogenase